MIAEVKTSEITTQISYEDFLREYMGEFAEWVDGKVETMSPITVLHDEIDIFLLRLLTDYAEERELGKVLHAPFQMRLRALRRGREPDIMFVKNENLSRLTNTFFDGPADLAIEIVSLESRTRDYETKFGEYEAGGVREYWIIDAVERHAAFWTLQDDRYVSLLSGGNGILRSHAVEGFWFDVNWLWQQPMPRVRQILALYDAG